MANKKTFIDINPSIEKEKYFIFKDLEKDGKSIITDTNKKPWWNGVAKSIGIQTKDVTIDDKRAIMPPISHPDHHFGIVITNKHIVLQEEKFTNISRFKIKRI